MDNRTTIAFVAVAFMSSAAAAQHSAPAEAFKFLSAKEVTALTDKPGAGAKTAFLADHENYYVEYAARTDTGNVPEVHTHWSHYIHILAGEGTLTYGGTVSNAKETGPGQMRGDAIVGGSNIAVHEGDYLQIPAGMPHLFVAAPGIRLRYLVFNTRQ
jgi:mannose-6-phosphate isomerase-like protein (cupin superfamily)